jgi:protein-tyrosine phosphatase
MGTETVINHAHRFGPAAPDEGHVYAACAPGWHSAARQTAAVEDWIAFMQDRDVRRVCCLLAGSDRPADGNVARYRDAFGHDHVQHTPIADGHLPDVVTLRDEILPFLTASRDRDRRVVVHGLAGIGRTGFVLAAWLVHGRGYRPRDAIDAVRESGRDPREAVQRGNATLAGLHGLLKRVA